MTFMFDRNFDDEVADAVSPKGGNPTRGMQSSARKDAEQRAHAEGFAAGKALGFTDGQKHAKAELTSRDEASLEALASRLGELADGAEQHRTLLEQDMLSFTISTCEAIFPELIDTVANDRAVAQVRRCLALAIGRPKIDIFLPESALNSFRPQLEATVANLNGRTRVTLHSDPDMAVGDARAEWENGGMHYSFARICSALLENLRNANPTSEQLVDHRSESYG